MEDRREQLFRIERERWEEFRALVDRVPADRMEEPDLNEDGWSIKDLLWHVRCWDVEIGRELEQIRLGTYTEHDYETDDKNARFLSEGRHMDLAIVQTEWLAARTRAIEKAGALPEVTPPVEEWFSELAYKHMDDHLPELRLFVDKVD